MKKGYYWIEIDGKKTIGYCDGGKSLAWTIIGVEEIFDEEEIKVLKKIECNGDEEDE